MYTMYSVDCTFYIVQCTLYIVHARTMYNVPFTSYQGQVGRSKAKKFQKHYILVMPPSRGICSLHF